MQLKRKQKEWDSLGKNDPYWAILSYENKKNNKWGKNDFFLTGKTEIIDLFEKIKDKSIPLHTYRALDFGCGIGRLTQPLAKYFEYTYGVDISPSMIKLARKINKNKNRCKYVLINEDNLKHFNDDYFDFIYSNITLQHIKPKYSKKYIKEFLRILAPGGLLIFQIPDHQTYNYRLSKFIKRNRYTKPLYVICLKLAYVLNIITYNNPRLDVNKGGVYDMNGILKKEVIKIIKNNKGTLLLTEKNQSAGKQWISYLYFVSKIKTSC
jgi:ubiquinone/menaquinone biosynthesis C-methylase UbiE